MLNTSSDPFHRYERSAESCIHAVSSEKTILPTLIFYASSATIIHTLAKAAALMMAMLGEDYGGFGVGFRGGEFGSSGVGGSDIVAILVERVDGDSCAGAVRRVMLFSTQSINGL